ncbi:MAG: alpha/beta fold hydrolase, partial [Xanthomonadales bacterium]|nr:alpha/beta fold hydrolase [Xanthomonadales bacterium]
MSRLAAGDFAPPAGLRNPHVQSALRSLWPSRTLASRRARALLESQQAWIMEAGNGVRLQGFYNRAQASSRGLAVLLHGWEGSSQSSYMLSTGARLLAEGYDVFRLNFRDHGDSHALNRGVFHSCRLDEVLGALGDMQGRTGCDEWQIAGFSLGGNFALRVALRGPEAGLGVRNCVAICPVLDPEHVLKCMETGPTFYERYYNRTYTKDQYEKKVDWLSRQLRRMNADIVGFQEVFHNAALQE